MSSVVPGASTHLNLADLAVATTLDVIADVSSDPSVHRTTLQAVLAAAVTDPQLPASQREIIPDRQALADALLRLRAQRLAVLDEGGFRLTNDGRIALQELGSEQRTAAFRDALVRLVGLKLKEWHLPA